MSPPVLAWRTRWRVGLRPVALWRRLRHFLGIGERVGEKLLVAEANRRYRRHPVRRILRVARPVDTTFGTSELLVHLDPRDALSADAVRQALVAAWPADEATLVVLVRWRRPPLLAGRVDAEVHSWAAVPALVPRLPPDAGTPLLTLLDAALRRPDVRIRVVQVGEPELLPKHPATPAEAPPTTWIVPHRGYAPWLGEGLTRIVPQLRPGRDDVIVGLDEPSTPATRALQAAFPGCWFGTLTRPGVGPFVVRQRAVEQTTCPHVLFQDSDDVPTCDRAARLQVALGAMGAGALDAVGSHELRLDYLTGRVVAVRFPLDASAALRVAMGHPALFPSLLVRRASLLAVGGFSTHLRFALDTQLLLRAAPTWRVGNVDAFLYLRRRHPGSLTTDPATALNSPAREQHRARWQHDYAAVLAGELQPADSSLAVRRGPEYDDNALLPL